MSTVILVCDVMIRHVEAAQKKMDTDFTIVELDGRKHENPKAMREHIIETASGLDEDVDTILVGMAYCGGSWKNVSLKQRYVIPRVDDCITMLLHTDDVRYANLKKAGHLYLHEMGRMSVINIKNDLFEKYGAKKGEIIFKAWFESYRMTDVIETGTYDCRSCEYAEYAKRCADLINCPLDYVPGSNIILEKLVSGRWDEQFIVVEPSETLSDMDFM